MTTPTSRTWHEDTTYTAPVIAVWSQDDDEPATARMFRPDEYAGWAETNYLSGGAFPSPARSYGRTPDGALAELHPAAACGRYDEDDYAAVTHTWTHPNQTRT